MQAIVSTKELTLIGSENFILMKAVAMSAYIYLGFVV